MVNDALELYSREDVLKTLMHLATLKPDIDVLKACEELATKIYWEKKDLAGVVAISLFGLSLGWRSAESLNDNKEKAPILSITKAIAYNLASFTWPGWDEDGIQIGPTDLVLGLSAAKINLHLAHRLAKGPLPLSRAHWMLGAQYLAHEEYALADTEFALSANSAIEAKEEAEVLLAEGFQALARLLGKLDPDGVAQEHFQGVKEKLSPLENAHGFIEQLDTAWRIFASKPLATDV
ncbi:hypothetical protein IAD21_01539 [Abditibacteriota bacterium]|nr:hypothetical protein IAD21_01539 [Abditibacteriota bacterium]